MTPKEQYEARKAARDKLKDMDFQVRERTPGKSVQECLDSFPADWGEAFGRAAKAAMNYWAECIDGAAKPS